MLSLMMRHICPFTPPPEFYCFITATSSSRAPHVVLSRYMRTSRRSDHVTSRYKAINLLPVLSAGACELPPNCLLLTTAYIVTHQPATGICCAYEKLHGFKKRNNWERRMCLPAQTTRVHMSAACDSEAPEQTTCDNIRIQEVGSCGCLTAIFKTIANK